MCAVYAAQRLQDSRLDFHILLLLIPTPTPTTPPALPEEPRRLRTRSKVSILETCQTSYPPTSPEVFVRASESEVHGSGGGGSSGGET
jgi:hypothetical protein